MKEYIIELIRQTDNDDLLDLIYMLLLEKSL